MSALHRREERNLRHEVDHAGLRAAPVRTDGNVVPGDIIVAAATKPVSSVHNLPAVLDDHRNGEAVTVPVKRQSADRKNVAVHSCFEYLRRTDHADRSSSRTIFYKLPC